MTDQLDLGDIHLIRKLAYLYWFKRRFMAKELTLYGLSPGHHPFLMVLYHMDGVRLEELARVLRVDKAVSTRMVRGLIEEGFAYRERDRTDKRAYRVFLTEKGRALHPKIVEMIDILTEVYLDGFSDEERILLVQMFDRMVKNVERAECDLNERNQKIMSKSSKDAGEDLTEEPGSKKEEDGV
ncbi:MarR family winged helix-turn-helix transcriptional regulator [Methanosphaerula palustris]|uniref:MarR family winged helix-turn-helix transcriptional regulator n=1 Tax=Methanosphaerula palustris TaxID=475088 RepID=UPI0011D0E835|nr:MarR family transcriptional regulator [Methanosphaerula palustris]